MIALRAALGQVIPWTVQARALSRETKLKGGRKKKQSAGRMVARAQFERMTKRPVSWSKFLQP